MVVAGLVQGVLVRWHGRQEVIIGAGEPEESPVDLEGDVLEDVLRVVGQAADVEQRGVGLHEWPVPSCVEVKSYVKEVDNLLVDLGRHLQAIVLVDPLDLLPQLLCQPVGECAGSQSVVAVKADVDREVLELVEEEESDEIRTFSPVVRPHGDVELLPLSLHPRAAAAVEDGLLAGEDDLDVLLRDGGEGACLGNGPPEEIFTDRRIKADNIKRDEAQPLLVGKRFEP